VILRRSTASAEPGRLVCTVSTVLDTLPNVKTFVRGNLAAGVDHMFVFLDGPAPRVRTFLERHPHVTVVRTGKSYWRGERPRALNRRQVVNANIVNCLLAPFDSVAWLFHIDGDERLDIDKDALLAVDDDVPCVHLRCWEAVSQQHWDGEVSHFKRLLTSDELSLLTVLGLIKKPDNRFFFNGHVRGKTGSRPDLGIMMRIHYVTRRDGEEIEGRHLDDQHLLHYESFSGEEFVRKWAAHLSSGTASKFSPRRDLLRAAIEAVAANPVLDEERKRELLLRLYREEVEDDFSTLRDLGYLETPRPDWHEHTPSGFSKDERRLLDGYLQRLCEADKAFFSSDPETAEDPAGLVRDIVARLGSGEAALAEQLTAALAATQG
jgi:hypothetical protein